MKARLRNKPKDKSKLGKKLRKEHKLWKQLVHKLQKTHAPAKKFRRILNRAS